MFKQYQMKMLLHELYYTFHIILIIVSSPVLIICAIFMRLLKILKNKNNVKNLKNQVAVITGSGRGLGRCLAIELAKRGCHLAIVDIQQDLAEQTANYIAENYPVKVKSYKVDVSDYNQLEELNRNVSRDLGDVTILINNAAMLLPREIFEFTPQEIQNMINVNFTAICFTHKIFLPKMKELNQGLILNISSMAALFNGSICDIYGSTKAAVRSLSSCLRMKLRNENKNISVTTVMPVFLNTHKGVEDVVKVMGLDKLFPIVESSAAVEYILDGLLNNYNEITVPYMMLYYYKLVEIFPISMKELITAFITARFTKNYLEH